MSYFPSPDPQKLRNAFAQNHAFYTQIPPTPARSHPSPSNQSAPMSAGEQVYHSESQAMSWHSNNPRGLGLNHLPSSNGPIDHGGPSSTEALSMSFSWTTEFPTSEATSIGLDNVRKDSWSEGCDPMSTLLHSGSGWSQLHTTQPEYHRSPVRSEYSNSTQASCMSSPYAYSDSFQRAGASPMVKLEDHLEYAPQNLHYIPETAPFDQSMLVSPGDLVTQGQHALCQTATTPVLHSSSTEVDEKPNVGAFRSLERRTLSSEDLDASYEGRTKRGFTKPETANCKCDKCGKLFQRSYNLKAHMETHDPYRSHPHTCEYIGCDKRFVRRTDLVRHEHSVHLKVRNFPCHLCDSSFARKDTLRRHIDDGCPKRPEVKKRMNRLRRPSATSNPRPPSYQYFQDPSPTMSPLRQPVQFA